MHFFYKKKYKGSYWDKIFYGFFSVAIVLETNLTSHTLGIPAWGLILIAILTVGCLFSSMLVRSKKVSRDVRKGKRKIVSRNAENAILIVEKLGWIVLMPLILLIFSEKDTKKLFWFLISAMLLLIVKYYFDDIVTFTEKGYSSGFDEIELSLDYHVKFNDVKLGLHENELFAIAVYKNDVLVGKDIFVKEDGLYLYNYLKASKITVE